ncbi:MAG: DNA-formamidopyrimidine glycosylase [Elusimicrobia bacterium]|nr:MAG: DNA-formamidopyrimidine glycosylase [Elusimicrobiota bacterium]
MPELPEVETVRRVLAQELSGRRITSLVVRRPTFYRPPPPSSLHGLIGKTVTTFSRRGKFLSLVAGARSLVLHLGMSGRLVLTNRPAGNRTIKHCRFEIGFEGKTLRFFDTRRFGRVGGPLPKFGPEPTAKDLTPDYLRTTLKGRTASIKALLMDQGVIAGLGNIYATEALFRSGIHPSRPAGKIKPLELEKLRNAILFVIKEGIRLRGSTLNDEAFLDPYGNPGAFQKHVAIYGRKEGACGHTLSKTKRPIASRSAVYCPSCQK